MSTIWNKGITAEQIVESFTIGNDRILDLKLAEWDVKGSMAHIKMLESIGLLKKEEEELLYKGLNDILNDIKNGKFCIDEDIEDIHSQIELLLTKNMGR
jgi:Argininosuccinate lyase